jgi:hypothetical protein
MPIFEHKTTLPKRIELIIQLSGNEGLFFGSID